MDELSVREPYLDPPAREGGKPQCKISREEAKDTLDYCNGNPRGSSEAMLALARRDMEAILAAFDAGEIEHVPQFEYTKQDETGNGIAEVLEKESVEQLKEPVYREDDKKAKKLPKPPEGAAFKAISEMDFEALKQDIPEGTIQPAMTGVLFPCSELRLPYTNGFYTSVSHQSVQPAPFVPTKHLVRKQTITEVFDPTTNTVAAVPLGMDIRNVSNNIQAVSSPSSTDPLIWRVQNSTQGMRYTLGEIPHAAVPTVDLRAVGVLEQEQQYWKETMPLPPDLQEYINTQKDTLNHKDIAHLIVSCMGLKDSETGTTNFVYACHPRLGQFYKENADDLPLLLNELKAGHCDLLSWWFVAQMRAQGIPAWVVENRVTTQDGTAFNKAYNHAVGAFAQHDGLVITVDPTQVCDLDDAYHPSVLSDADVCDLEEKLLKQWKTTDKVAVLRGFVQNALPAIRERAKDPDRQREIQKDRGAMLEGGFFALLHDKPAFQNTNLSLQMDIADWSGLPKTITPETMQSVVSRLGIRRWDRVELEVWGLTDIARIDAKHKRELYAWLLRTCNHRRASLPRAIIMERMHSVFNFSEPISIDDLEMAYSVSQANLGSLAEAQPERVRLSDYEEVLMRVPEHETLFPFDVPYAYFIQDIQPSCAYDHDFIAPIRDGRIPHNLDAMCTEYLTVPSGVIAVEERLPRDKREEFTVYMHHLARDLQFACIDGEHRNQLLQALGIGTKELRDILKTLVGHSEVCKDTKRAITPFPPMNPKTHLRLQALWSMLYLNNTDTARVRKGLQKVLRRFSAHPSFNVVWEPNDTRQYAPGDDIRKIDWNAYARLDELFTKSAPDRVRAYQDELVVYISHEIQLMAAAGMYESLLQLREMIRELQRHAQQTECTVYITTKGGAWHKLPQRESPQNILASLISDMDDYYRAPTKPFVLPKNLLVLGESHGMCAAMEYLYGSRCNLQTVYLHDPHFRVFPLARECWVKQGLQEELKDAANYDIQEPTVDTDLD